MNNHIKTLANGDFEVVPLDDPKAVEFHNKRNYHYSNTDNPIDFPTPMNPIKQGLSTSLSIIRGSENDSTK